MPKTTLKQLPDSTAEITVSIPAEVFNKHLDKAAAQLAKTHKIKGFRPGKAPRSIVEKYLGSKKLLDEAAEGAINDAYPEVIKEHKLRPVARPSINITKIAPENAFEFVMTIPVISELSLPDYSEFTVEQEEPEITDEEITHALHYLQKTRAVERAVERASQKGDAVEIDFETRLGAVKVENGESRNHPLVLGEGSFLPGFEEAIEGLKAGERKEFSLVAPKDYYHPAIAGKKVDLLVTMRAVRERKVPELNDEFANSLGQFTNLAELKNSIREGLLMEKETAARQKAEARLIEKISDNSKVTYPSMLLESELSAVMEEHKTRVARAGLAWESYLANVKKTEEQLREESKKLAETRVKLALVMDALVEREGIAVEEAEITERANAYLRRFASVKEAKKHTDPERLMRRVHYEIRKDKLLKKLAAKHITTSKKNSARSSNKTSSATPKQASK